MKQYLTFRNIIILLLCVITITFLAQNAESVEVKLLFWTIITPRSVVIISSLLVGGLIGFALGRRSLNKQEETPPKQNTETGTEE